MLRLINRLATSELENQHAPKIAVFGRGWHSRIPFRKTSGTAGTNLNCNILFAANSISDGRRNDACIGIDLPQLITILSIVCYEVSVAVPLKN